MKRGAEIARFNRFLKLFGLVMGLNSVLWFAVYTQLLASIQLFNAVIDGMRINGTSIGYFGFWNSVVVLFALASYGWLIVEA